MNIKWDSNGYTDNFQFVHKYGEGVLELLTAPKGSFVVDLGCGNGALTEKLVERGYRTLGIDASPQMLEKAKALHPELDFRLEDACKFRLEEKADAIFSNAVFHWIDDHKKLVKNISRNLKSGGEFVFEFGGKGNGATVHNTMEQVFSSFGLKYKNDLNFRSIGEFAPLLEKYGFSVKYAVLYDRPTEQVGENGLENWINMFLGSAFDGINEETKAEIIEKVVEICRPKLYTDGKWFVDYVRLQMKAIKL